MANAYLAGNKIRLSVAFTDSNAAPIDPGTVSLEYAILPAAPTVQGYNPGNIVRDSTGAYHYDLDTTGMVGTLTYEWVSTGVGQAAVQGSCYIQPDPV
jgi:hypothetical protein